MLRLTFLFVLATFCEASLIPYSYQSVVIYPRSPIKIIRDDALWKSEDWKKPKSIDESFKNEWRIPEEWKKPEIEIVPPVDEWEMVKPQKITELTTAKPENLEKWESGPVEWDEAESSANYNFQYEINHEPTGDIKSHSETVVNGAVKGQYSLIDSDGFKRIVDYTADDHNGFQATVKREPTDIKILNIRKKLSEWQ